MLAVNLLDPESLLRAFGVAGLFFVMFIETGLLVGFFLPGDSLLITAGLLAATPPTAALHLSLPAVVVAAAGGAVLGAQTGYVIGRRAGPRLLDAEQRPRLQAGVERAAAALDRYGVARAVVLARFIPLVRTVLNPLAGTLQVDVRTFTVWQIVGGLLWTVTLPVLGWSVGSRVPGLEHYMLPVIAVLVVLSFVPVTVQYLRGRADRGA